MIRFGRFSSLIVLIFHMASAPALDVDCSGEGNLSFSQENAKNSIDSTEARFCGNASGCPAEANPALREVATSPWIKLTYPLIGPNRLKASPKYSREVLSRIVRTAIVNGVDPFLAVALLMMEKPPVFENERELDSYREYVGNYGEIPVDAFASKEYLGCLLPKSSPTFSRLKKHPIAADYNPVLQQFEKINENRNRRELANRTLYQNLAATGLYEGSPAQMAELESILESSDCVSRLRKRESLPKEKIQSLCQNPSALNFVRVNRTAAERSQILREQMFKISARIASAEERQVVISALECGPGCPAMNLPQTKIPTINIAQGSTDIATRTFCSSAGVQHGVPTNLSETPQNSSYCCVHAIAKENSSSDEVRRDLSTQIGVEVIKKKIFASLAKDKDVMRSIQRYNGLGCIGCTEKISSDCFSGINTSKDPIYGARVADLMVNSVMNNQSVAKIVLEHMSDLNLPLKSIFCLSKGQGRHRIQPEHYLNEQKRILISRPACQKYF